MNEIDGNICIVLIYMNSNPPALTLQHRRIFDVEDSYEMMKESNKKETAVERLTQVPQGPRLVSKLLAANKKSNLNRNATATGKKQSNENIFRKQNLKF